MDAADLAGPSFTMDMQGCARCHGDGHPGIEFRKFNEPCEIPGLGIGATHWATCPTTGEPILFLALPEYELQR